MRNTSCGIAKLNEVQGKTKFANEPYNCTVKRKLKFWSLLLLCRRKSDRPEVIVACAL